MMTLNFESKNLSSIVTSRCVIQTTQKSHTSRNYVSILLTNTHWRLRPTPRIIVPTSNNRHPSYLNFSGPPGRTRPLAKLFLNIPTHKKCLTRQNIIVFALLIDWLQPLTFSQSNFSFHPKSDPAYATLFKNNTNRLVAYHGAWPA